MKLLHYFHKSNIIPNPRFLKINEGFQIIFDIKYYVHYATLE